MAQGYAAEIIQKQDKEGMLQRSLERIIQLYTDKSHFVYELLQNAEDALATSIKFIQYDDRLEVMHDGKPFTTENLQSLCDVGRSDKVLNQIGEFGVGFKSVFSICDTVKLYSEPKHYKRSSDEQTRPFAIRIDGFVNPVDIEPDEINKAYTTRFVFPYSFGNSFSGFDSLNDLKNALTKKLQNLGITTLLFMKNLELIEYEIRCTDLTKRGEYLLEKTEINDHCSRVSALGSSTSSAGDDVTSYLMFSRRIDEETSRTVDIAFPVKEQKDGSLLCVKPQDPYVSVYFPTETESKLNFIVQGPYRTTPNRSSIPADNIDNKNLVRETAILLEKSILELKNSGVLNMSFLKALPIDEEDFSSYSLFLPLYYTVLELLSGESIIPTKSGSYANREQVRLARQERLTNVLSDRYLTELINTGINYYWLPTFLTETNKEYVRLYRYLYNSLDIKLIRPEDLRSLFNSNPDFLPSVGDDWLIELYSVFESVPFAFSKTKNETNMLMANIVKTSTGSFVAPYRKSDGHYIPNVFVPNKSVRLEGLNIVEPEIYDRCHHFFDDILQLPKPDVYEYEINRIKKQYSSEEYEFDENHYAKDVKFLLKYLSYEEHESEVTEIIKNSFLIKCDDNTMRSPYECHIYLPIGLDDINIKGYYQNIYSNVCFADIEYYSLYGISSESICKLGVKSSIVVGSTKTNGIYPTSSRGRDPEWYTIGDFRWEFSIDKLRDAILYISRNPESPDSFIKSQVILRTLLMNENRLVGTVHIRGNTQDLVNEPCEMLKILSKCRNFKWDGRWLYTESLELVLPKSISKHDLNTHIYGSVRESTKVYQLLGFKKTAADEVDELKKSISQSQLDSLFENELRNRFGISSDDLELQYGTSAAIEVQTEYEDRLPFPISKVKNWEALKKHVAEMLIYADPVRYENVIRSIRTSDRSREARSYLMNLYRYDGTYKYACQMCHDSCSTFEKAQLFDKPKTELDPLNLCLCPNCASKYKKIRNKTVEMQRFREAILSVREQNIADAEPVVITLEDHEIWFSQVHFAEIISLLKLQKEVSDIKKNPSILHNDTASQLERTTEMVSTVKSKPLKNTTQRSASSVSSAIPEKTLSRRLDKKESGLSVYKGYIGKQIKRKLRKFSKEYDLEGTITNVDNEYVYVDVLKGKDKGKTIKIQLSFIIQNKSVYEIS